MTDSLLDLSGKVALVTGGSRGLGKAMVTPFAAHGADVIIASRKLANCQGQRSTSPVPPRHSAPGRSCGWTAGSGETLDPCPSHQVGSDLAGPLRCHPRPVR